MEKDLKSAALFLLCFAGASGAEPRPNILWLTAEDANVKWFGCYGSTQASTPNIDRLAREGFRYTHAFATAPVCAASRSSWITGIYSLSTGTYQMRSRYDIPHDRIAYYPDILRAAGYWCSNHMKTDYNIGGRPDPQCWNSTAEYGWITLPTTQPFFSVINYLESHESRAFGSVEYTRHDPSKVVLEQYHPDLPAIRKNYALYEDAVENMDRHVGLALEALKRSGKEDSTIVIFCTDHGGVLPRSKHYTYEAGLHSPLIVRIPARYRQLWPAEHPGLPVDRLVSYIDMPKTWLALAGAAIPPIMQGRVFLGPKAESEPDYAFAYRGRMDERYDETRVVHDKRFIYIKNYMPYVRWGQHHDYLWHMAAMQAWEDWYKAGKTNEVTGLFFQTKPWVEELYDCDRDSDCVHNLSTDPAYAAVVARMRAALTHWQLEIHDPGLLPESELARRAAGYHTTIFELVRDPRRYPLSDYLAAADKALAHDPADVPDLVNYTRASDSGLRYWGACGLLMQDRLEASAVVALQTCLKDESHDVRAMAAWALIKSGQVRDGQACLIDLLHQESYATLKVLNVIDWMGVDTSPYLPAIRALRTGDDDPLMRQSRKMNPQGNAYADIKEYLLHPSERPSVAERGELIEQDEEALRKAELNLRDEHGVPWDEKVP